MRAKKKNVGYAIVARTKGRSKFTMEDLKTMMDKKNNELKDQNIKTFE